MLGAALVMAALVGGCSSSGSSPTVLPPVSTTPVTTSSSAPAQDPKAAAVAVVREFFRLINNLEQEMDASAFESITSSDCPCRSFASAIRQKAAIHEHYFGRITLTSAVAVLDSPSRVQVLVTYDSTPGGTAKNNGTVIYRGAAHTGAAENFVVRKTSSRWLISVIAEIRRGRAE